MKIQILSDTHFEFHRDQGKSFIKTLDPTDIDVLVVAGDLATIRIYEEAVPALIKKYPHIVLVNGNHEFYGTDREMVQKELDNLSSKYDNFHVLEDSHVTIGGQRFIGSTLWFSDAVSARPYQRNLNDFRLIRGFKDWIFETNSKSMDYLHKNVEPTDIVVTHHIPTQMGSNKRWHKSPMQSFFVCDMEQTLITKNPKLWIFGHTHDSFDGVFDKSSTRLICNPFGYKAREENPEFQKNLVVSV